MVKATRTVRSCRWPLLSMPQCDPPNRTLAATLRSRPNLHNAALPAVSRASARFTLRLRRPSRERVDADLRHCRVAIAARLRSGPSVPRVAGEPRAVVRKRKRARRSSGNGPSILLKTGLARRCQINAVSEKVPSRCNGGDQLNPLLLIRRDESAAPVHLAAAELGFFRRTEQAP